MAPKRRLLPAYSIAKRRRVADRSAGASSQQTLTPTSAPTSTPTSTPNVEPLSQISRSIPRQSPRKVLAAAIQATVSTRSDDTFESQLMESQPEAEQYQADRNPVKYWIQLQPKYPALARFAIDIMTIPASSSDCGRLFSELGDLLEPKRRRLGSQQLAALQLARSRVRAGFKTPYSSEGIRLMEEQIIKDYIIDEWDTLTL